jgi:2-amino-4-hydroxy-6-hydroxymethyldihydropteridine diphosphokinase
MTRCLIALGANIGASEDLFDAALLCLAETRPDGCGIAVLKRSDVFRTAAVGENAGGEFLNAAALVETDLSATALLAWLHDVEHRFGRVRMIHWGPRRLDLDLVLFGDEVISQPELVVPHPACWYRKFVLAPAAQVAAEMRHPLLGETMAQLNARLDVRPLQIAMTQGSSEIDLSRLLGRLRSSETTSPIEWQVSDFEGADHTLFAVLQFDQPQSKGSVAEIRWSQPLNEWERRVVIQAESIEQAVGEVRLFCSAALGT